MAFIDEILQTPSYGWKDEKGKLVVPTYKQLFGEFFSRMNIFKSKKNWISTIGWGMVLCMLPFLYFFIFHHFSIWLLIAFIVYAMIIMGTHGTIWFHRFCAHNSYTFRNKFWRFVTQNLVVRTVSEEVYVLSHHVHHVKSDEPGDPYNPKGGFMYCMLADVNHQGINKNLNEKNYNRVAHFMRHIGVKVNGYSQYLKWGSVTSPVYAMLLWIGNWVFWYSIFYLIAGHGLACAMFSAAMFWFVLVRAFNYTGHGKGEIKHTDGLDFDRSNLSINQWRPGYFAGEWHNNHHLFPASARAGFLKWQLDLPWVYIYTLYKLGAVKSFHDSKKDFMKKFYFSKQVKQ